MASPCPLHLYSDRFRTMINVLGDALAAGIIAHLCRKDFPLGGAGKVKMPSEPDAEIHSLYDSTEVTRVRQQDYWQANAPEEGRSVWLLSYSRIRLEHSLLRLNQHPHHIKALWAGGFLTVSLCFYVFPLQPVPSYGTHAPHTHNNSHSVDVPMTEIHLHKDSVFEVTGDSAGRRHTHTVYYNICQVWVDESLVRSHCAIRTGAYQETERSKLRNSKYCQLRFGDRNFDRRTRRPWHNFNGHSLVSLVALDKQENRIVICTVGLWVNTSFLVDTWWEKA